MARYIGRHGTKRVAKAVLIAAIPPLMLKTAVNPGGLPIEVFDGIRAGVLADRSQFFKDLTSPFYGANRAGAKVSQGLRDSFWLQGMQAGFKNVFDLHPEGRNESKGRPRRETGQQLLEERVLYMIPARTEALTRVPEGASR